MQKHIPYKLNIDPDTILTPEEQIRHKEAMEDLKNGNYFLWEDVKKELGIDYV